LEINKKSEIALDIFIGNPNLKTIITQAAFQSKHPIIQAGAIQVFATMLK